jgi:hypothetical protein
MSMLGAVRGWLRRRSLWNWFQEVNREGWSAAWRRSAVQGRILDTPPMYTALTGPVEIRVLTWRRDWVNLLWALKSFYYYAEIDYPLYIHDGGLTPRQTAQLRLHFPTAYLPSCSELDARVEATLHERSLNRCLAYRRKNVSVRKLFDFFLLSTAELVLTIDSDIVFFRRPAELLVGPGTFRNNLYNQDEDYWYSLSLDELESSFGVRPPSRINSGLALIRRTSIDFDAVERWLSHPKLFADSWVTEQTLHALCSTLHGVELLPSSYRVSTRPGLANGLVCKHYPGYFRPLLYEEGMTQLLQTGFLQAFRARFGK